MVITDLGPLEQGILEAVVGAETLGLPQDCATLHRLLPRYRTHSRNVTSALSEGRPLRHWLLSSGPYFVLRDRANSAVVVSAGRRRARAAWAERSGAVRGLSKLPWVEAVAAVGPFAQGFLPTIDAPLDLVVIAEGGRADLARRALGIFRRARRMGDTGLRILAVLDADHLSLSPSSSVDALLWASLQPVVGAPGWEEFRSANPWLQQRFPNHYAVQPDVPALVSERRLEGRLAGLRRARLVAPSEDSLLRSELRRGGLLGRLEERASGRLGSGSDLGVLQALSPSAEADYEARLESVRTWAFEVEDEHEVAVAVEPAIADQDEVGVEVEDEAEVEAEVDVEVEDEVGDQVEVGAELEVGDQDEVDVAGTVVRASRRVRGPDRRGRGRRAGASPEEGQSASGQGRRRQRGRR
jgi:hypothetical protein